MAMLYPPSIDGKIPAQVEGKLKIPFRLNRSVSISSVKSVVARIKTISTSTWLDTLEAEYNFMPVGNHYVAEFDIPKETVKNENGDTISTENDILKVGVYYKIQLAFRGKDDILGYYSTIGVFKYTKKPEITILGLDNEAGEISNIYNYIGKYSQKEKDPTEKIYNYQFIIRDAAGAITEDSGLLVHDNTKDDVDYESIDEFSLEQELQEDKTYTIEYKVVTMNGLEASSGEKIIASNIELQPPEELQKATLLVENDFDNGTIKIGIRFKDNLQFRQLDNYKYILTRSSLKDNYTIWNTIMEFSVQANSVFPTFIGEDYTIEQGEYYKYALQLENTSGLRSARLTSKPVLADFEDMFLYDGARQLKIRFNPKVTSLKNTLLETKIDTLGGRYPFFFRNGNVQYKEFPLSGLISFLSDSDGKFMTDYELGFNDKIPYRSSTPHDLAHEGGFKDNNDVIAVARRSTQLDAQNFAAERAFKLFALDWLNNGKPKLFRSPAEGNYIVRIMNNSLSPNDTLGRMLHTFSGMAYEMAEPTYRNMVKYGFIQNKIFDEKLFVVSQVYFKNEVNPLNTIQFDANGGAYMVQFLNMKNNTKIEIKYADASQAQSIVIGPQGNYVAQIFDTPILWARVAEAPYDFGKESRIEYGTYIDAEISDFSPIHAIKYRNKMYQATGKIDMIEAVSDNIKFSVGKIYNLRITRRTIVPVWKINDEYHLNDQGTAPVVYNIDCIYYDAQNKIYIDGASKETFTDEPEYVYHIKYKNENFYHSLNLGNTAGEIILSDLKDVEKLVITNGLMGDMFYQELEKIYGIELSNEELITLKNDLATTNQDLHTDKYIQALNAKIEAMKER